MTQRRNGKTLIMGSALLGASMLAAFSVGRGDAPVATPMEEVLAARTSSASLGAVSWDLPVTRNEHVDDWIAFLKGRNRDKTERWLERSGRYTSMIRDSLRQRGMPEDLIYLAFIESGYNPNAASHAAAVGLWQFIKDTGRRYGMEVSSYVDERRDPIKSTSGALDYLQELYDRFGSWYLAAAAYNTGENRVARIMREQTGRERGRDSDFWMIADRLPAETRNYVPLMLAAGHIGKEPEKFGFSDLDFQDPWSFATVRVPKDVPLSAVAKAVGVERQVIEDLNPELIRDQTPPTREWDVRVPVGSEKNFAVAFPVALREIRLAQIKERETAKAKSRLAAKSTVRSQIYRVKRGDTLSGIAKRYGTTVKAIARANGGLVPSRLKAGQSIRIPKRA